MLYETNYLKDFIMATFMNIIFVAFILSVTLYTLINMIPAMANVSMKIKTMRRLAFKTGFHRNLFFWSCIMVLILFPMNMLLYHFGLVDLQVSVIMTCFLIVASIQCKWSYNEVMNCK